MSKKGFTLIELLAVILILGIIAVIAIPTVNDIIIESKKNSLKSSAINIQRTAEQQCEIEKIRGANITKNYTITDRKVAGEIGIKSLPESGIITVDDECNVKLAIVDNGYCATREGENTTINSNIYSCTLDHSHMAETKSSCFIFNESTKTITGYKFNDATCPKDIVIPNIINDVAVENIGDFAFTNIPTGYIPMYYMYAEDKGANFTDIIKANADTYNLALNTIEIIKLKDTASKMCYYTDKTTTTKISNYIGTNTDNIVGCYMGNYDSYTTSGSITSVDFTKANNLKTIGNGAFMNNKITNVYFDMNNTFLDLGSSIFANNLITNLDLRGFNYSNIPGGMFYKNAISTILFSNNITTINNEAFLGNSIIEYNFPSSLIEIKGNAFKNNSGVMTNFVMSDNIETIGSYAFYRNSIHNIKLGSNLRHIGNGAFYTSGIYTIDFNTKLEDIGSMAFYNNYLSKILLKSTLKNLESKAFNRNIVANVSDGMYFTKVENGVSDPTTLVSVSAKERLALVVPEGIVTIANGAVENINFNSVSTPSTLKTIEKYGISGNLVRGSTINISSSVTTIEDNAFYCPESYKDYCVGYIKINKPAYSIPGYGNRWGNPYANVTWNG